MSATYQVKDVARIARVTVRALHHYDAIGLLVPSGRTRAGYRLYSDADLVRLQQILLYREFGLTLEEIRAVVTDPAFDTKSALMAQRQQLLARRGRTDAMIRAVDRALATLDGDTNMDEKELFDGFDPADYEDEARERWGTTDAYAESTRRTKRYSKQDWQRIKAETDDLLERIAERLRAAANPTDPDVMDLAEEHRLQIDRWYYPCSHAMHCGLAQMYVADARFTANFDKHAEGLAAFLAAAIDANASRRR